MFRNRLIIFMVLAIALALPGVARADRTQCPTTGTPAPGTTVDGGLDVDGLCILDNVTVNGGITILAGGHLQFTNGTVNGGILTLACGELDINATTEGSGVPTNTNSTINGGIDIIAAAVCTTPGAFSDVDIYTAQIDGGISMTGTFPINFFPFVCSSQIRGGVHLDNVTVTPIGLFEGTIGDPNSALRSCPGNMISGSFHMTNSKVFAVEANTIGGSALLDASTLELNGNTINGSLMCSDGTVILPPEPGDTPGNTVGGKNTCP